MEHHVFKLPIITKVTTEKASQFILPLASIYNTNVRLNEQKCIFEHFGKVKTRKIFVYETFLFLKILPPFSEVPL